MNKERNKGNIKIKKIIRINGYTTVGWNGKGSFWPFIDFFYNKSIEWFLIFGSSLKFLSNDEKFEL